MSGGRSRSSFDRHAEPVALRAVARMKVASRSTSRTTGHYCTVGHSNTRQHKDGGHDRSLADLAVNASLRQSLLSCGAVAACDRCCPTSPTCHARTAREREVVIRARRRRKRTTLKVIHRQLCLFTGGRSAGVATRDRGLKRLLPFLSAAEAKSRSWRAGCSLGV